MAHQGGKAITPEQPLGNFGEGATLCIWIKLKDPTEPVHNLLAWELGGGISYMASEQSFAFGRKPPSTPISGLIFEAEKALLRGPSPKSSNGGIWDRVTQTSEPKGRIHRVEDHSRKGSGPPLAFSVCQLGQTTFAP